MRQRLDVVVAEYHKQYLEWEFGEEIGLPHFRLVVVGHCLFRVGAVRRHYFKALAENFGSKLRLKTDMLSDERSSSRWTKHILICQRQKLYAGMEESQTKSYVQGRIPENNQIHRRVRMDWPDLNSTESLYAKNDGKREDAIIGMLRPRHSVMSSFLKFSCLCSSRVSILALVHHFESK
jgi:hypothetical protein